MNHFPLTQPVKFIFSSALLFFAVLLFVPAQVQSFFAVYSTAATEQPEKSVVVYKTISGVKFHKATCYHLNQSMIPILLDEAIAKGLSACKRCQPSAVDSAKVKETK